MRNKTKPKAIWKNVYRMKNGDEYVGIGTHASETIAKAIGKRAKTYVRTLKFLEWID